MYSKRKELIYTTLMYLGLAIGFIYISLSLTNVMRNNTNYYFFGYQISEVVSGSMEPLIMTDELILTKKVKDKDVIQISKDTSSFEGVYVYKDVEGYFGPEQKFVVHRCIGIDENGDFIFKGDANKIPDPVHVKKENIIASVEGISKIRFNLSILYLTPIVIMECVLYFTMKKWYFTQEEKENNNGWESK